MSRETLRAIRADALAAREMLDALLARLEAEFSDDPGKLPVSDPQLIADLKRDEGRVGRALPDGGFIHVAYPDPLSPRAKEMRRLGIPLHKASDPRVAHLSGAPWTWGYGHTGPDVQEGREGPEDEAEAVLALDVEKHNAQLASHLPWVADLDPARRRVLQNMAFNLGVGVPGGTKGLLGFKNTLGMIQRGEYAKAAEGMLRSLWANQVGARARPLAETMRTGS